MTPKGVGAACPWDTCHLKVSENRDVGHVLNVSLLREWIAVLTNLSDTVIRFIEKFERVAKRAR